MSEVRTKGVRASVWAIKSANFNVLQLLFCELLAAIPDADIVEIRVTAIDREDDTE